MNINSVDDQQLAAWLQKICPFVEKELLKGPTHLKSDTFEDDTFSEQPLDVKAHQVISTSNDSVDSSTEVRWIIYILDMRELIDFPQLFLASFRVCRMDVHIHFECSNVGDFRLCCTLIVVWTHRCSNSYIFASEVGLHQNAKCI